MKNNPQHTLSRTHTAVALILALLLLTPGVAPVLATGSAPALRIPEIDPTGSGASAPASFTAGDQATIRDLIREAEYQFIWQENDGGWAYRAPNRAQDLSVSLAADGFHAARTGAAGQPLWDFALSLAAYGWQTFPAAIAQDDLRAHRERVEYHWGRDVVEWYVNSAAGIEHGLTLAAPPPGADDSTVKLTFALRGSLRPELDASGRALHLVDSSGEIVLVYDQLAVYDATGCALPASFSLSPGGAGEELHFTIDTAGAIYPLVVDPIIHAQTVRLTASVPQNGADFGNSVAISGDTVVVGEYQKDGAGTYRGAAYVFARNKGGAESWGLVSMLAPDDPADADRFGNSVAISGDTVVIGAYFKDDAGSGSCFTGVYCGAAYVFERNRGGADNWGQVQKLLSSDVDDSDFFGHSVAISGDTIVVGAYGEDGGGTDRGAAYVFSRNHGGVDNWGQRKKLIASPAANEDWFGYSVAISEDTVVVGAYKNDGAGGSNSGAVYLFGRNKPTAENWGQVVVLKASDAGGENQFGKSVAISGDTAIVGAPGRDTSHGAAYVLERNKGGVDSWGEVAKLTAPDGFYNDWFGRSVSISGDHVVVGAQGYDGGGNDRGAAYVYERNQGGADIWGQVSQLTATVPENAAFFGGSVAICGHTIVAGADGENGEGTDRGAAYLYTGSEGEWREVAIPRAEDASNNDQFGISVAISGDRAIVGAHKDDSETADDRGAAYIIERNKDGADKWGQVTKLFVPNALADSYFGRSVSISGDTAVVGVWGSKSGGTDIGAAYVYERNHVPGDPNNPVAENWGQVAQLRAPFADRDDYDRFGFSVSISGDTIVVGAYGEGQADTSGQDRGAAYVFARNEGGRNNWGQVAKLIASDKQDDDHFGYSVSISGDTIVVGAYGEDGGAGDPKGEAGAAYVYRRNQGGIADYWGQVQKLTAHDAAADDRFGVSVAISVDTIVVGAYWEDGAGYDNRGAAYLYERNEGGGAGNWGQARKLLATDPSDHDQFGISVGISGDRAVVGSYGYDDGPMALDRGQAYVYDRNKNGTDFWGQLAKLRASDTEDNDYFGRSVSISGDTILVGAFGEDGLDTGRGIPDSRGAAYIYTWQSMREITVSPNSLDYGNHDVHGGPSPAQQVTITNEGVSDLHISGVSLTGGDSDQYGIVSDSGETTLAPGGTRTVQVTFDPTGHGTKWAALTVASDDDDEPTVKVSLTGIGVFVPDITVTPGSVNFGFHGVDDGPTPPRLVTITNIGAASLMLSGASLAGADAAEFAIASDSGEPALATGESRTLQITFDPSSTESKSAELSIVSDDPDEPTVEVTLWGNNVWRVLLPLVLRDSH